MDWPLLESIFSTISGRIIWMYSRSSGNNPPSTNISLKRNPESKMSLVMSSFKSARWSSSSTKSFLEMYIASLSSGRSNVLPYLRLDAISLSTFLVGRLRLSRASFSNVGTDRQTSKAPSSINALPTRTLSTPKAVSNSLDKMTPLKGSLVNSEISLASAGFTWICWPN